MQENQTQFSQEEPLHQDVYNPNGETELVKKPLLKSRKALVLGSVISVCVLVLVSILLMPKRQATVRLTPSPTPAETVENKTGFDKRLSELESELNRADPTDTVLPFPAVDMNIALEQIEQ